MKEQRCELTDTPFVFEEIGGLNDSIEIFYTLKRITEEMELLSEEITRVRIKFEGELEMLNSSLQYEMLSPGQLFLIHKRINYLTDSLETIRQVEKLEEVQNYGLK